MRALCGHNAAPPTILAPSIVSSNSMMMISTEKISHHSTPHFRKSWVGRNLMFWLPCHICENIIFLGRVDIFLKPTELRHILDFRILFICKKSHKVSSCSSPERVVRIWSLLLWNCDTLSSLTHAPGSGRRGRSVKSSGNKELKEAGGGHLRSEGGRVTTLVTAWTS